MGINVAYLPPQQTGAENIGFAIPSQTATSVADQIIDNGKAVHPYLGVYLSDLTPQTARRFGSSVQTGALIEKVASGGPASQAGIRRGDIVVAAGNNEVQSSGDLISALRNYQPGDTIQLTVVRDGQKEKVQVNLAENPQ
jgi:S1-C subfamily serine protease